MLDYGQSSYTAFDYIEVREADDTPWKRQQAGYSQNSVTEHDLEEDFEAGDTPPAIRKVAFFNQASGGTLGYVHDAGRSEQPNASETVTIARRITLAA